MSPFFGSTFWFYTVAKGLPCRKAGFAVTALGNADIVDRMSPNEAVGARLQASAERPLGPRIDPMGHRLPRTSVKPAADHAYRGFSTSKRGCYAQRWDLSHSAKC